ncbi:hypothetical protein VR45_36875, partial [Streptomyces sp. NRRL S-495]
DHDVLDSVQIRQALTALATDLGARLRAAQQIAKGIELQITYADRSHTSRTRTLKEPTAHTPALTEALNTMFTALGLQRARIRAVTARVTHLAPASTCYVQLTLDPLIENQRTLEPVIDKANGRYGTGAITPAVLTPPHSRRRDWHVGRY